MQLFVSQKETTELQECAVVESVLSHANYSVA